MHSLFYTAKLHIPWALLSEYISGEVNVGGESAPYRSTVALHLSHKAAALPLLCPLFVKVSTAKYTTASKINLLLTIRLKTVQLWLQLNIFFCVHLHKYKRALNGANHH